MARASIFWLVGQYAQNLEKVAPDILRKAAKSFINEADIVKLQIINLGAKLYSLNPTDQILNLLFQYVLDLARYDLNYDIRDRARLLRGLILINGQKEITSDNGEIEEAQSVKSSFLKENLKQILLCEKEAPSEESPSAGNLFISSKLDKGCEVRLQRSIFVGRTTLAGRRKPVETCRSSYLI